MDFTIIGEKQHSAPIKYVPIYLVQMMCYNILSNAYWSIVLIHRQYNYFILSMEFKISFLESMFWIVSY